MTRKLEIQEKLALEYLVSAACRFVVEIREEDGAFFVQPASDKTALEVGDFQHGQRFWRAYRVERFPSPFQAAALFVNAVRLWERTGASQGDGGEPVH